MLGQRSITIKKCIEHDYLNNPIPFKVIGFVESCFKEKFGIPCQPGLVTEAKAVIKLAPPYDRAEALAGLEHTSHIWVQFVFHQAAGSGWKPTVRPPRLGGNRRMGVFATRSPVRPNPLGLSVVKLEKIALKGGVSLHISGADLLDGSPVVDIKPYVPYVDCVSQAWNNLAEAPRQSLEVVFDEFAQQKVESFALAESVDLFLLIEQVLSQDPRPQFHKIDSARVYGMKLLNYEVKWRYTLVNTKTCIVVTDIILLP